MICSRNQCIEPVGIKKLETQHTDGPVTLGGLEDRNQDRHGCCHGGIGIYNEKQHYL